MVKYNLIDEMRLDGGVACLDFVNTVPDRLDGTNRDLLNGFDELAYYAKKSEVIDSKAHNQLLKAAAEDEKKAHSFFKDAIKLRDLIYRIFKAISDQKAVSQSDMEEFNKVLPKYLSLLMLEPEKRSFAEKWNTESGNFYSITAPIVKSAYELLLSDKLDRIKECPNCGWLFFDTSKNGKRRWCSMQACGSNVKALEYYHRQKQNKP